MQGRSTGNYIQVHSNVASIELCKKKCEETFESSFTTSVAQCRSIVYHNKACAILAEPYDATGRGVDYTFQYAKMSEYFNSYMKNPNYGGECGRKAQCSTIATAVGFCGSKVYDSSRPSNTCAASACSSGTSADISACCSAKAPGSFEP